MTKRLLLVLPLLLAVAPLGCSDSTAKENIGASSQTLSRTSACTITTDDEQFGVQVTGLENPDGTAYITDVTWGDYSGTGLVNDTTLETFELSGIGERKFYFQQPIHPNTQISSSLVVTIKGHSCTAFEISPVDLSPTGVVNEIKPDGVALNIWGAAQDPDTSDSITVTIYVDGQWSAETLANEWRDIGNYGFSVHFDSVAVGWHEVCVTAQNVGYGSDRTLGCEWIEIQGGGSSGGSGGGSNNPRGYLDGASVGQEGYVSVWGWAVDDDEANSALDVDLYIDGNWVMAARADQHRDDVGNHAFGLVLGNMGDGNHSICARAKNVGGGADVDLGCQNVSLRNAPFGRMDSNWTQPGRVGFWGFAADPNAPGSAIPVHIYANGNFMGEIYAGTQNDQAGAENPGFGSWHGFEMVLDLGPGQFNICAYAINVHAGPAYVDIGCQSVSL